MSEAATQQGVETKPIGNTERNSFVAELAAKARSERDEEIRANGGEIIDTLNISNEEPAPEPDPKPEPPQEIKESPSPEPAPEPKPVETPADDYVTVKVDGQERQVLKSQIIEAGVRTLQKESAADRRLEEATRLLREAQETAQPKRQPLPDMDEAELAHRIRMGSDEEAAEAMRVLKGRETATPEEIAAFAENRAINRIKAEGAIEWFQTEYKEIFADPYLVRLALGEDERMLREGDQRSYRERYQEIGNTLRDKIREWKGGKAEIVPNTDKQERKATITNLPAASARQPATETPKPKTQAQIIEEMRKRRGQSA